ncbi:MAG: UvrD-helicase domain-containing protein [Planctomycetaceae bacterium]|nr:UvrD-helicase domain-containing protein [Planctomycetaceae bacterium]
MSDHLTDAQRQAVEHVEGPLMVLAGPGSGKTRVITHRIANLLKQGVYPNQILALTFTNKAAREMAERVEHLLGGTRVFVSTFHRFCSRLLRRFPEAVGLKQNFTILDQSDQVQLVRRILKDLNLDPSFFEPSKVLARISRARNDLITSEVFCRRLEERVGDPFDSAVYQVFPEYEQRVLHQNAVDFDDLLLHVVRMLQDDDQLRETLDDQFRFVLVDEYQDTNLAQYRIVQSISQLHPNLCATGDPDQSIYGWRGARASNITSFERDFPQTQVVSLDQNFRSTKAIVSCADQLIRHNPRKHRGRLTTPNEEGTRPVLRLYEDGEKEADGIALEIAERVRRGDATFSDFAVFYRVNALSRSLENAFARHRIPAQVAAGFSFFERAEIRDLIAYLRLIENPADDSALERIINRPARGIGNKTLLQLTNFAHRHGMSVFAAAQHPSLTDSLTKRARKPVAMFVDLVLRLNELSADGRVTPVLERLIADIDYLSLWKEEGDDVDVDRAANVHELIAAARQYDDAGHRDDPQAETPSLQGFLELTCLSSEADNISRDHGTVTLMTLHASKGLEFPHIYIIGLESGLIPHERAVRDGRPDAIDEERRLLYVGITRAMHSLVLTQTMERTYRGARRTTISSPFVPEVEPAIQRESKFQLHSAPSAPMLDQRIAEARRRFEQATSRNGRPAIMTAADMEAGRSREVQLSEITTLPASMNTGMQVRHPRYGCGTIVEIGGSQRRPTVTVRFDQGERQETFVLGVAPLMPLGIPSQE